MKRNVILGITVVLVVIVTASLQAQAEVAFEPVELPGERVADPLTPLELATGEFEENGNARIIPPPHAGEFTTFPFGYSRPLLTCGALKLCQIELQPGEALTDEPLLGDLERWDVDQTWSGEVAVVVVKPKSCDVRTNLLIITDRRRYVVDLEAPACEGTNSREQYMPGIRFWYPGEEPEVEEEPNPLEGMRVDVRDLNTNYRWQTSRRVTWNLMRVFDDGVRTIIQFTPEAHNGEMPVLYGMTDDGTRVQVNVVIRPDPAGDYLIADRVLTRGVLVLREGDRERKLEIDNLTLLRR
jgi:P-type conjugative transfer protein TrbG